jgi:beta-galactosidase
MFRPGEVWNDTDGNPIQAHGGGVLFVDGTYYWYGENKSAPTQQAQYARTEVIGVSCYSSRDLVNWKYEGIVLGAVDDDSEHDLHTSKIVERPKVIFNEQTGKYVMWMHIDSADYSYARAGVAVSDSPTGTFRYMGSIRPCGFESRDITLFKDDDGRAYLIFSSEWNKNTTIALLDDEYLNPTGEYTKVFIDQSREAPTIFKANGMYYMVTSGCTGWEPNEARYATAPAVLAEWTDQGSPCVGIDANKTFYAQSTFAFSIGNKGEQFVFMADRWNSHNLSDSRYVWLPIHFEGNRLIIPWADVWQIEPHSTAAR